MKEGALVRGPVPCGPQGLRAARQEDSDPEMERRAQDCRRGRRGRGAVGRDQEAGAEEQASLGDEGADGQSELGPFVGGGGGAEQAERRP